MAGFLAGGFVGVRTAVSRHVTEHTSTRYASSVRAGPPALRGIICPTDRPRLQVAQMSHMNNAALLGFSTYGLRWGARVGLACTLFGCGLWVSRTRISQFTGGRCAGRVRSCSRATGDGETWETLWLLAVRAGVWRVLLL